MSQNVGQAPGALVLLLIALAGSGCFTHSKVPGRAVSLARSAPLSGDFVLQASSDTWWQVDRLGPDTAVRFEAKGRQTPWMYAGDLEVSDDGFVFGRQTLRWAQATGVAAGGLDDQALRRFAACAPSTRAGLSLAASPQAMASALDCIDDAQQQVGGPVPGTWQVTFGEGEVAGLTFAQLAAARRAGFTRPSGLRFEAVDQVEVANFNASLTAVTVVVVAVVAAGALAIGGGSSGSCGSGLDWDRRDKAPVTVRPDSPALDLAFASTPPSLAHRRRLFSEAEARRSTVRMLGWVDLTTRLEALKWASVTPFLGVRLFDTFEAGLGATLYWAEPLRRLPVQNTPLGVPVSPQVPTVMPTVRVLLNLELDPYRRVDLPLGLDVAMGAGGGIQVRLRWGLRLRLWQLRLGFFPFSPTSSDGLGTLTPPWTFPSTVEVGAEW